MANIYIDKNLFNINIYYVISFILYFFPTLFLFSHIFIFYFVCFADPKTESENRYKIRVVLDSIPHMYRILYVHSGVSHVVDGVVQRNACDILSLYLYVSEKKYLFNTEIINRFKKKRSM